LGQGLLISVPLTLVAYALAAFGLGAVKRSDTDAVRTLLRRGAARQPASVALVRGEEVA
jgi:hypothetical protein